MTPVATMLARLGHFLRGLFRRDQVESELRRELDGCVEMLVAEKVADGMSPQEARRAARLEFGRVDQVAERVRDVRPGAWIEQTVREIQRCIRSLARSPGFTLIVVLTLGVGIGANAATFSFIHAMMLRPMPFPDADRLVAVQETSPPSPLFVTPGDYVDWKAQNDIFDTLSGYTYESYALTAPAGRFGDAEVLRVAGTSSDFFRTLRVRPLLGRTFLPDEDQAGRERAAVLSHGLWTRRFGSDRGIVGREIALDGRSHTVIGVMPADFDFPVGAVDAWAPMVLTQEQRNDRRNHYVLTVGRLRPGVSLRHARARMQALGVRFAETHPQTNTGRGVEVVELQHEQRGVIGPFLVLGQLAAVFVLLIACANVSNLQVARAASRGREMSVRAALGAGRWHIRRLVVIESLLLALVGSAIGIAVAMWGVGVLKDSVSPDATKWIQGFPHIAVDWTVLGFSLALAVIAGTVSGLAVSSEAWRHAVMDGLREGSPTGSVRRASLRRVLVAAEVALAVVVTVSAGQMIQGFQSLVSGSLGFSAAGVGTMRIRLHDARIDDPDLIRVFHDDVLASASAVPGVDSAALVSVLPARLYSAPTVEFRIEGRSEPGPGEAPLADLHVASPDYFRTVGIPLLDGRTFDPRDASDGSRESTVVISERLARQYWPGENPLGQRLRVRLVATDWGWWRVVGVVGDVRQNWWDVERPSLYLPATVFAYRQMYLTVRGTGTVERLLSDTAGALGRTNPDLPVFDVMPLSRVAEAVVAGVRAAAGVMGVFGALALLLSAVGVYGVMAYAVRQREREFGIRMALGALPGAVLRMVVRQGLAVAGVGLCLGLAGAAAMTRMWASLLFGTSANSAAITAGASMLVCAAVLVACCLPARLATRVDPIRALRCD